MKLKYVGCKEEETAFSVETDIVWYPGSVEEVSDKFASRMLQHPDVFARADDDMAQPPAKAPVQTTTLIPSVPPAGDNKLEDKETLLGSDMLPALIDIGNQKVQLGTVVASAFTTSGLSAADWNGLDAAAREDMLAKEIVAMTADALNPPDYVIELADGTKKTLDGMDVNALRALAKQLAVSVHPSAGIAKVTAALVAAFPLKK